ncbi:MAG: hypothetical protein LBT14_05280 [Treponema sp.]|jgi:hypothetical protein|nr:hypothetical protein [Treponema sp.]
MRKNLVCIGITGIVLLTACIGGPKESFILPIPAPPVKQNQLALTIDYKTKASGEEIPEWVGHYEREGIPGIESLQEYQNKYVFVAKNTGANFNALSQWTAGFMVTHDFAQLVASRLQTRLTDAALLLYPDDEYGSFFEAAVKAASDTVYDGAAKEADFWLLKQYQAEDGVTVDREVYDFLVLVSITKNTLRYGIQNMLNTLQPGRPPTKNQIAAINRVKGILFENF